MNVDGVRFCSFYKTHNVDMRLFVNVILISTENFTLFTRRRIHWSIFSIKYEIQDKKKTKRKRYEETLISNTLHSSIIRCISKKKWKWFYSHFLIPLNSISVLISMESFFFLVLLSIHLLLSIPFYLCSPFFFPFSMELYSFFPWRHCCMHIA